jgi:hypothetical protein
MREQVGSKISRSHTTASLRIMGFLFLNLTKDVWEGIYYNYSKPAYDKECASVETVLER